MKKIVLILACSLMLGLSVVIAHAADEGWPGVDDTVVGKYADAHGRPAKPHLIEPTGDALLFAFLVAGAAGGFTMGYYYHDFMTKNGTRRQSDAG